MKIFIYIIYFPTSDRLNSYYVGQTAYLERRMSCHLISKSLVGNALRKYDDWTIEILHTCKSRDEANRIEIEEIRHYNCVVLNGYNLTRGGDGVCGYEHTKEWKQNQSRKMQGNKNGEGYKHTEKYKKEKSKLMQGENNPFYNKKHSKETIEKNRKAQQGKCITKETKEKLSGALQGNKNSQGYKHSKETREKKKNNKYAVGKRFGRAKINIQIAQLKRRIRELD